MDYSYKLTLPDWLEKRYQILCRDGYLCQICQEVEEKTLQVHHKYYDLGKEPWEYDDRVLITLCLGCHESEDLYRKRTFKKLPYSQFENAKKLLIDGMNNIQLYNHCVKWIAKQPPHYKDGITTVMDVYDDIIKIYLFGKRPENTWKNIKL